MNLSDLTSEERQFLVAETARQLAADLKHDCEALEEIEVAGLLKLNPRTVRKILPYVEPLPGKRRYSRKAVSDYLGNL